MKLDRIVLASGNTGKLAELIELLAPLGIRVQAQADFGVVEAEEPHCTFIENALLKARRASRLTGLPAIADDSGLCVDALGGRPGVLSARWASAGGNGSVDIDRVERDRANNAKLVQELAGCNERSAYFYCVLVLLRAADDPQPIFADASWAGEVIDAPRGSGGFGYDPHLLIPSLGRTVAELEAAAKNRLSHRGRATRALIERLREAGAVG
jgi:XTP/dITP diphosphohydrolase